MDVYIGLDVSLASTAICVLGEKGKIVTEAQVASAPDSLVAVMHELPHGIAVIGLEDGPPTPVLIETFVETPRFTGALYKASGWTLVETTKGRGRYDRHTRRDQPKKDIWLRPLRKDWRRTLNR